jgi:membrane-bound serine protease (ClpP class)
MRISPTILGLGLIGACAASSRPESDARPQILQITLADESITPAVERYFHRALQTAQSEGVACVLVVLDTPGGLVDSTRAVVRDILGSTVPVVVYVSPSGARAASGGMFVLLAGHVAAMAPGTHLGAAHPVAVGGLPISPEPPGPGGPSPGGPTPTTSPSAMDAKIVNDTVAWARALAQLRGRNPEWAARAVSESLTATASEAHAAGVIDLTPASVDELMSQLDGREVVLEHGRAHLHTAGAQIRPVEMWWGERLLGVIANPNVAFLLLVLGFYAIIFELYTTTWGVAGTVGVLAIILAFFGLAILPVNYVGLILILVALGLFVAEAFVTSHGLVALAGAACLVLGGLMLVESPAGFTRVSLGVLIPVAAASAAITSFLVAGVVRAHRRRPVTGSEGMVREFALAQDEFRAADGEYAGCVLVHGELWNAVSERPVHAGERLEVQARDGLKLRVRAHEDRPPAPSVVGAGG